MANWEFALLILTFTLNVGIGLMVLKLYRKVYLGVGYHNGGNTHLRYFRNREDFNKIGIEVVSGAVAGDVVYAILRTGTFSSDFEKVLGKFRTLDNTELIIITPDKEVFLSNCHEKLLSWITELYENSDCVGVRGLLLEPKLLSDERRRRGYLFISDGHVHKEDDGFYTNSSYSANFLLGYFRCLTKAGTNVYIETSHPNFHTQATNLRTKVKMK